MSYPQESKSTTTTPNKAIMDADLYWIFKISPEVSLKNADLTIVICRKYILNITIESNNKPQIKLKKY